MLKQQRLSAVLQMVTFLITCILGSHTMAGTNDYSKAMRLAVDHWLAVQKPSGFFPYIFDFLQDREWEPELLSGPNLTRQALTAAVLADYYAFTNDQRMRPMLQGLLTAFRRQSLPIGKSRMQILVEKTHLLSLPIGRAMLRNTLERFGLLYRQEGSGKVLSPDASYSNAYTGAVAFALLTELYYAQASRDTSFADLRQAWLEALIGLHIPGRGFRIVPTSIDQTPYFDGEAWLALAHYQRAFPDNRGVAYILSDVDDGLLNFYGKNIQVDFFHWGAMAAAARYTDTQEVKFLNFIKTQMRVFLDRMQHLPEESNNNCAGVEGLADALAVLGSAGEGDSALAGQAQSWIAREMFKVAKLQIQPGQKRLVFPNAQVITPRLEEFAGSFLVGVYAPVTQVDATSHCVSAMLKLQRHRLIPAER